MNNNAVLVNLFVFSLKIFVIEVKFLNIFSSINFLHSRFKFSFAVKLKYNLAEQLLYNNKIISFIKYSEAYAFLTKIHKI